jgi:hypothetical protein
MEACFSTIDSICSANFYSCSELLVSVNLGFSTNGGRFPYFSIDFSGYAMIFLSKKIQYLGFTACLGVAK